MVSENAIMALALCPCGHGIGRHDERGCPGANATFCMCTLTSAGALDAAIEKIHEENRAVRVRTEARGRRIPVRARSRSARGAIFGAR